LHPFDDNTEKSMIGKNNITDNDSPSTLLMEEEAKCTVERVENIAGYVKYFIIQRESLNSMLVILYDLYFQFSYTCP
jgi:hypothetical protein